MGAMPRARLPLRTAGMYTDLGIEVRLGCTVGELDLNRRQALLESGEELDFELLLIATGGRARRLPGLETALHLRDVGDSDRLRERLGPGARLEIVGAGFIGSEVASAALRLGAAVTVHEALAHPLERVLGPEVGAWLAGVQRSRGVDLRTGVKELPRLRGRALVAAGAVPNAELARRAGIVEDGGIFVDEVGRTSVEGVYAAGDVARFWSPTFAARIHVEHFQTAARHGRAVGRAMAGAGAPFLEAPWFWSDQFGLRLEYAGAGLAWDEIAVRGELGRPPFTVFYLRGDRLVAAFGAGDHRSVSHARRLLEAGVSPPTGSLADPARDLRSLVGGRPGSGAGDRPGFSPSGPR